MEVNDGLLTCVWFEEGEVFCIGHEEILGEDSWAEGVAENVEILLDVGIAIGHVGAELHAGEVFGCCGVEVWRQLIGTSLPFWCVGAPAARCGPISAVAEGVGVDWYEDAGAAAMCLAVGIDRGGTQMYQ